MNIDIWVTAITPGIAFALMIYFYDRYDREPLHLILKLFAFGILSSIPVLFVEMILSFFNGFSGLLAIAYSAFVVAGLTEEFFKRLVVMKIGYHHVAFNEKLDGIVYAVMVSLGFATLENVIYVVFSYRDVQYLWIYRAVLSVPAHMLFAITMGYYFSLAKFAPNPSECQKNCRKSLYVPILLHGSYNFIVMSEHPELLLIFIPFLIYLWLSNLRKLNRYYKESKLRSLEENNIDKALT